MPIVDAMLPSVNNVLCIILIVGTDVQLIICLILTVVGRGQVPQSPRDQY